MLTSIRLVLLDWYTTKLKEGRKLVTGRTGCSHELEIQPSVLDFFTTVHCLKLWMVFKSVTHYFVTVAVEDYQGSQRRLHGRRGNNLIMIINNDLII